MAEALVGSRYSLHVAHRGANERKFAPDYHAIHPGDRELDAPSDDPVGYVHSYEVGSIADGPGLRFVVFLTGCPLRCAYCHSPDTWHKFNGHPVTVARLAKTIRTYAAALRRPYGGVTFSGGEPLMQPTFLMAIARRCRHDGLHTCLDTSGHLGTCLTDDDLASFDLHLLDIKAGDPGTHERVTHQPLAPTLEHARRLSTLRRPMWIRYPLVPGLTDAYDNVEQCADFCGTLQAVERVEILRFHQMGRSKWERLGLAYPVADVAPPAAELVARVAGQFRSRGLTVC